MKMTAQHNHRVHKGKDLIEAKFKLPLIMQRILAICISKVNPQKLSLENPYRFTLKEYCALAQCNPSGMHKEIRNALKEFQGKTLTKYDPDLKRERLFNWTSKVDVWDDMTYDIYFHEELATELLAKKMYASYLLNDGFRLKSQYSFRLFELCKQWEKTGQYSSTIDDLRAILGVDDGKYPKYAQFKQNCLKKSVDEINKQTYFKLDFEEIKRGRRVDSIVLNIRKSKTKNGAFDLETTRKQENKERDGDGVNIFDLLSNSATEKLVSKLSTIGITKKTTESLLKNHPIEVIEEVYQGVLVLDSDKKAGILINKLNSIETESLAQKAALEETGVKKALEEENRAWFETVRGYLNEEHQWNDSDHRFVNAFLFFKDSTKQCGSKQILWSSKTFRAEIKDLFEKYSDRQVNVE